MPAIEGSRDDGGGEVRQRRLAEDRQLARALVDAADELVDRVLRLGALLRLREESESPIPSLPWTYSAPTHSAIERLARSRR